MIELLASAGDGWAIARESDRLWLVRPPYGQADRHALTATQLERALVNDDFVPASPDRTFEGWGEFCRHLEDTRVQDASPEQLESTRDAALRLLARADSVQAKRHLAEIRSRLSESPSRRVEEALVALLKAEAVDQEPSLRHEVLELLERAMDARKRFSIRPAPPSSWPVHDVAALAADEAAIREHGLLLLHARPAA